MVTLSFLATGGATLLVLGCALANYNWWPIFVVVFHILSPLPIIISRRCTGDSYMSDPYTGRCVELSAFLTSILVISAYMLPVIMANTPIGAPLIKWSSAAFIFAGNSIIFLTIYIFVRLLLAEDNFGGW
ncbi:leptin receptor gene-related [Brachionus plicatilis]|uniref:Leptin receptor gene-related n=1 Tax=Brachionus plicatilis TaxID=10195 RepID=A0A3M7SUH4_BRAPC|nr:leptin receptor gene-related [Brachionus plicatilis]